MFNHRAHWPRQTCLRLGEASERSPRAALRGFTLVELLVTISVIAVLMAILVPALAGGIKAARSVKCIGNHHQIAIAWIMYTEDHVHFPISHSPELTWGGVDWYTAEAYENNTVPLTPDRPVNVYIGSHSNEQSRSSVFQCPSDHGLFKWGTNQERYYYSFEPEYINPFGENDRIASRADDAGENLFASIGTSYRANDWIWVKPGSVNGGLLNNAGTSKNKPDMVADHSSFVLVADAGMTMISRADLDTLGSFPLPYAWWHGEQKNHFAFLDGSARAHKTEHGTATTTDYTYYFDDRLHKPWSKVFAWFNGGNPPQP